MSCDNYVELGSRRQCPDKDVNVKELLIDQFTTCYDTNGWLVAAKNAIAGVTAEQAEWKPEGADNSMREIVKLPARTASALRFAVCSLHLFPPECCPDKSRSC